MILGAGSKLTKRTTASEHLTSTRVDTTAHRKAEIVVTSNLVSALRTNASPAGPVLMPNDTMTLQLKVGMERATSQPNKVAKTCARNSSDEALKHHLHIGSSET